MGPVVAEVIGKTIFVLFDLPDRPRDEAAKLMEGIMESFEKVLPKDSKEIKSFWRGQDIIFEADPWSQFIELFRRDDGVLEMSEDRIRERFDELDLFAKSKKGKLVVTDGVIRVPLGRLTRNEDTRLDLGEVLLVILPKRSQVKSFVISPGRNWGFRLPHGDGRGGHCLGNAGPLVREFLMQKEFALLADLMVAYHQTG